MPLLRAGIKPLRQLSRPEAAQIHRQVLVEAVIDLRANVVVVVQWSWTDDLDLWAATWSHVHRAPIPERQPAPHDSVHEP
jgi:hypothetical protein